LKIDYAHVDAQNNAWFFIFLWMNCFVYSAADYDTLRALDSDNTSTSPSMSEEEINALPVHKYRVAGLEK
jgi:hypothetical protein